MTAISAAELKAEKAAKKKARLAAKKLPPPTVPAKSLITLELFEATPQKVLDQLIARAEPITYQRDQMIVAPGMAAADPYFQFVVSGQVGCGEYTDDAGNAVGTKVKAEIFKKVGQTLAVFAHNDFFVDDMAKLSSGLCLYAITEAQVIRIKAAEVARIVKGHKATRRRLREHSEAWLHRIRALRAESGRDEIFDFYVKQGFSFSTRTKIRQLELCIDCDKCVQGCEDRHGFARIERFGPQVGLINFSVTCRQCYDPRCLVDCNFDAIARDPVSQEIRIEIENCTGCSVCARNCPNDSIFIHDITPDIDTSFWEDAGKKVPKRVAQKCDRCAGHDDMACITACPTGSMVDAVPELIFGLDNTQAVDQSCSARPFEDGWSEQATPRALPKFLYLLAALLMAASTLEWVFRRWYPHLSYMPVFPEEVTHAQGFESGRGLGLWVGIIGASCMVATLSYVIRNRFETETSLMGGKYFWFSVHNALGVLGPALVFLHGNLIFAKWPVVGVYSMIAVVVSGFVGQYLANKLPGREYMSKRERLDLDKTLQRLSSNWGEHTRAVNVAELMIAENAKAPPEVENLGALPFFWLLITSDVRRFFAVRRLKRKQLAKVRNKEIRAEMFKLMKEKLLLDDQERFFKTAGRLLSQWKIVHIFFSVGLFLLMALHVAVVTIF
jgi:Fe-S-cluster-containing hydrogenase component 2